MYMVVCPSVTQDVTFLLSCTMVVKWVKVYAVMVFAIFNNVPPSPNTQCFTLQRNTKHYCMVKII